MIIKTKSNGADTSIDGNLIMAIKNVSGGTEVYLFGCNESLFVDENFTAFEKEFIDAKSRDRITDAPERKTEVITSPVVEVGTHKFSLQIYKTEFEDGRSQHLKINANFPLKNEKIKQFVELIDGVEKYCDFTFNKYEGSISVGRLFDIDEVRYKVESAIKELLED